MISLVESKEQNPKKQKIETNPEIKEQSGCQGRGEGRQATWVKGVGGTGFQ